MSLIDWMKYSFRQVQRNGYSGLVEAYRETIRSFRRRSRRLHVLTSSKKKISISGVDVLYNQNTVGEWDHIQAIKNEDTVIEDAIKKTEPDDIVWDIGANVGAWSLFLSNESEKIFAFEPVQSNQQSLLVNSKLNSADITVLPQALSDKSEYGGKMKLDNRGATAGAGRSSILSDWEGAGDSEIIVPISRGEDLIKLPDPTIMKIDVEGAERRVIEGLGERLSTVRLLYIEIHGGETDEIRDMLSEYGLIITAELEDTGCGIIRAEKLNKMSEDN